MSDCEKQKRNPKHSHRSKTCREAKCKDAADAKKLEKENKKKKKVSFEVDGEEDRSEKNKKKGRIEVKDSLLEVLFQCTCRRNRAVYMTLVIHEK